VKIFYFILAVYGVTSLVAFIALALDKRAAVKGKRRTPEATLHLLELLGGWPGAIVAMFYLRHKNRKLSYCVVVAGIVCVHAVAWWFVWKVAGSTIINFSHR
jgi:uncharacterized membrane protein YsdA (DUF1294 family)